MPSFSDRVNFSGTSTVNMSAASTVNHKAASVTTDDYTNLPIDEYSTDFGIDSDAAAAAKTRGGVICRAAGTIKYIYASLTTVGTGSASIEFICRKDGTTIHSGGAVAITAAADSALDHKSATLTTTTVAAGDILDFDLATSNTSGTPTGPKMVVGIQWTATKS